MAGMGNIGNGGGSAFGQGSSGLLSKVDGSTVVHAAVIALLVIVLYHVLFQR